MEDVVAVNFLLREALCISEPDYTILDSDYCNLLFESLSTFRTQAARTPSDLRFGEGEKFRNLHHFDPMSLVDHFDYLDISKGYLIDYLYWNNGRYGKPLYYVRRKYISPFIRSRNIYRMLFADMQRPYLQHIKIARCAEGVLQLLLFVDIMDNAHRFPINPENHTYVLISNLQLEELLLEYAHRFSHTTREKILQLDLRPRVQFSDTQVTIQVHGFNPSEGISEQEYQLVFPGQFGLLASEIVQPADTLS